MNKVSYSSHRIKCDQCGKLIGEKYITSNGGNYHKDCYEKYIMPRCAFCGGLIEGRYITSDNKNYHNQCYEENVAERCSICGDIINDRYITSDGKGYHHACYDNHLAPRCIACGEIIKDGYKVKDNKNYHIHCYEEYIALKCSLCDKSISGKYTKDYWGNCYHPYHKKEYPKCEYCGRLICEALTGGGREYSDGRRVCRLCFSIAIPEDENTNGILKETLSLLEKYYIVLTSSDFNLILVDKNKLAQLLGWKYKPKTQGTMRYEEEIKDGVLKKRTLTVYVLFGLPHTRFMSVLVHELVHVYSKLFFRNLSPQVEEGVAVLFSYLILKEINNDEAKYLIVSLEENDDPVYGDSFRKEKKVYDKLGLENYIKRMSR